MRLSNEEKLKLISEQLEQGVPLYELAKRYDSDLSKVKQFVGLYQMNDEDVFLN
jgi:transposase-like protein